ncbi:MAG: acyl-CoA dehydrogenase [Sphingomonadales bacterium RIFCSPHIGHO2_01_FULL_65_20]|uniref:acyl-CoA dehydrogenase n=1 Tax=unclassified Blastomonas TaxID=2626550 RepID=UPI00082CDD52|nr:acyl-CoA dehydrogenase [Blastomonas sp.]MCH2237618.1 acyl-CoA dehydrogenase [Blastomonas sp.]OHC96891.1 MAG: acyl-CoA dehydrogenase [Sphingomonadales bacterium RIFCSPHIGHO2_01_FULL_65_20]
MTFTAPTTEQLFVLKTITGIEELAGHERFAEATPDLVEAIVEGVGEFAAGEFAPLYRIGDTVGARLIDGSVKMPEGYREAYQHYVEAGWSALSAPADHGGQGLPFSLATVALDSLGAANMAFALCPILTVGAIEALHHHGSDSQKALYLPKLSTGEWTGTMNLTEPQAGSDVGALRATATPRGDGTYAIRGQKIYISFGDHDMADNIIHLVLARTPDAPAGTKGISLFLVPKYRLDADGNPGEANGIKTVSIEHKMGINASPTCVLQFGEEGESIGELIGPEFGGMRAMFTMMNNARLNVGLQGVQIAEGATQKALWFARERVQSARAGAGRDPVAIIEHPDVRRMLLRMKAGTEAIRALLYYASGQVDRANLGVPGAREMVDLLTPLAKTYGTDLGSEIASLGVQIHGGMGYVEETGAAQYYRDIRIAQIYEGTNGIQAADLVGRKLGMAGGDVVRGLIAEVQVDAGNHPALASLAGDVAEVTEYMVGANVDDRLAGSYPYCTMMAVMTAGWLMLKQQRAAQAMLDAGEGNAEFLKAKLVTTRFYLERMVPEASGLKAAAMAGADLLYALDAEALAA